MHASTTIQHEGQRFTLLKKVLTTLTVFLFAGTINVFAADEKADAKKTDTKTKGAKVSAEKNPVVTIETSMGNMDVELYQDKAPISVANFLKYVEEGSYSNTIFHRVIDGFMIQGGGFTEDMKQKPTKDPIKNEANNGLKNEKYTLAMARTNVVDSATSQFFINVSDNVFLNHKSPDPMGYGYAVFGKVIGATETVDKIKVVPTSSKGMHENVPVKPVVIKSIKRK